MLVFIRYIHGFLPPWLWVVLSVVGLWGLVRAVRRQELRGPFVPVLIVTWLVVIVQAVLGAILWVARGWALEALPHVAIGVLAAGFLGVVAAFRRSDTSNRWQWIMGAAALMLVGLVVAATATGTRFTRAFPIVAAAERQAIVAEAGGFIDAAGAVAGDPVNGERLFARTCQSCHGPEGLIVKAEDPASPIRLGALATAAPLAVFEVAAFGDGERLIPGFVVSLSVEELIDIVAYAQTLPRE